MRHALAEGRSLAYHRAVAERPRRKPALIGPIRARLAARATGAYHARWLELLDGPLAALLETMTADDEPSRALRQATPFANLLAPRERWSLWARVRAELEGHHE